jgi:hypothetical protein
VVQAVHNLTDWAPKLANNRSQFLLQQCKLTRKQVRHYMAGGWQNRKLEACSQAKVLIEVKCEHARCMDK